MPAVWIGIGSNIEPEKNLRQAVQKVRGHFSDVRFSSVYRSAARDYEMQADFLNAVATFETPSPPEKVLQLLQSIEEKLGKAPPFRFGPRTIDLDLLLYGNLILPSRKEWLEHEQQKTGKRANGQTLFIPHMRMHQRRFVLEPLCELLDPQTKHPVLQRTLQECIEETKSQQCDKTALRL